ARGGDRAVRSRRAGAAAAALGRAAARAGDSGVLAGAHRPAARPAAVPAHRGRVRRRAARPVTALAFLRRHSLDTRPLRIPPYRRLFIGNAVSNFGFQFTAVAVPVQMYAITRSNLWVGLIGMAGLGPLVVFG